MTQVHVVIHHTSAPQKDHINFDLSDSDLSSKQKDIMTAFPLQNRDDFATSFNELGQCNKYMHKIETLPNAKPVKMTFYRATYTTAPSRNQQAGGLLKKKRHYLRVEKCVVFSMFVGKKRRMVK